MDGQLIITEQWRLFEGQVQQRTQAEGQPWTEWATTPMPNVPMYVFYAMPRNAVIDMYTRWQNGISCVPIPPIR